MARIVRRKVLKLIKHFDTKFHYLLERYFTTDLDTDPVMPDESVIEYAFVIANISHARARIPLRILDVGCASYHNCLPAIFAAIGHEVWGIDQREFKLRYPTFRFVRGDIRKIEIPEDFFDIITAVSTIEHIGLSGRYGSEEDPNGDKKALLAMRRMLKPTGKIYLTVPYGKGRIVKPWHRVYDDSRLNYILSDFIVEQADFYRKDVEGRWILTSRDRARVLEGEGIRDYSLALLKVCKPVYSASARTAKQQLSAFREANGCPLV